MSGEIEYGKCEICGKETRLERTYFLLSYSLRVLRKQG